MGFTSYEFIFFFVPVLILGWYCINKIFIRNKTLVSQIYLILMSLAFYGWNNVTMIAVFMPIPIFNWVIVFFMQKVFQKKMRLCLCVSALIINIGVWLFFKCNNLFNIRILERESLLIPLGISFYTIQQIMFLIDSFSNRNLKYNITEYLTYSTFFPCIVSGPIVKHDEFIPQLQNLVKEKEGNIDSTKTQQGIISFSLGMGKKVIIAKQLGVLADYGFSQPESISSLITVLCIIAYSLQLYFDFSGYCDMAEGISLILGFSLPRNFESPYKAKSIGEFWKKWHITLTRFLTQYVYIPLGGGINGKLRQSLNIVIVYIVSGFWHGAALTYIIWGGIHATLTIFEKLIKKKSNKKMMDRISRGVSYILISLAWVPFRAENISDVMTIYRNIFICNFQKDEAFWSGMFKTIFLWLGSLTPISPSLIFISQKVITMLFLLCMLLIVFKGKNVRELREQYSGSMIMAIICGIILWASVLQFSSVNTFIYEGF